MYQGGYTGKILRINLTDQSITKEDLPQKTAKDYIGGAGFCIKYLFDEVKKGEDPLGPGNKLIFAPGPFTGTKIPCASRMAVGAKSPLTNTIGVALTGGYFPVELKYAGYDAVIIEGKAEKPTYIQIKDSKVQLRSAVDLWGMKTSDCQQVIKNKLNDQSVRIACIGPAGENLSKMASIINEMRAAGRRGLGAVMGSKNLKAIAIKGTGTIAVSSAEKFKPAVAAMKGAMKDSPTLYPFFSKTGTSGGVDMFCSLGIFAAKNYSATGEFEPVAEIGLKAQSSRRAGRAHCSGCPVGCTHLKRVKTGAHAGTIAEGPEFETLYSFGGMTGVEDIDSVIAADRLADEYGLDTISAGVTIAFAMELYEKGILNSDDTGGMELNFGNHIAMLELLRLMSFREGIGDLLADGTKAAAEKIGKGSEKYAMHVKGLELPAYDPRGSKAQGVNYATAYCGADHNRGYAIQEIFGHSIPFSVNRFDIKRKGELTAFNQDMRTAIGDCTTFCIFVFDMALAESAFQIIGNLLSALTGFEYTQDDFMKVGERINNIARAFNVREGFTRAQDTLPNRLLTEPLKAGASKGHALSKNDLDEMLDEYYTKRGWDLNTGNPKREKLVELGLEYVADIILK